MTGNSKTLNSGHKKRVSDFVDDFVESMHNTNLIKRLSTEIYSVLDDLKEDIRVDESISYLAGLMEMGDISAGYARRHFNCNSYVLNLMEDRLYRHYEKKARLESLKLSNPGCKISKTQFMDIGRHM
jgi:hypothetical protein